MIYFIQNGDSVKIGYSCSVEDRFSTLQTGSPFELRTIAAIDGGYAEEKALHERFNHLHIRGEWFRLDAEIMAFISEAAHPHRTIVAGADPIGSLSVRDCDDVLVEVHRDSVYVSAMIGGKVVTLLRATKIKKTPDIQDKRNPSQ